MTLETLMTGLETVLTAMTYGTAPNTVVYFDDVWIGMPDKIPMGDTCVAIIEVASIPDFYYTMCSSTSFQYDVDIQITIMNKGHVETAHKRNYVVTEAVMDTLAANDTISGACSSSTLESVDFGDVAEGKDLRNLIAGSRIILKCKME